MVVRLRVVPNCRLVITPAERAVHVEVHAAGLPHLVALAATDRVGVAAFAVDDATLEDLFGHDRPLLFFRVFDGAKCVASTEGRTEWDTTTADRTLRLDLRAARALEGVAPAPCVVRGKVWSASPARGWNVRASDRSVRGKLTPLGHGAVDEWGRYTVEYAWAALAAGGKAFADLVVEVLDASGAVRHASDAVPRAPAFLVADVVVDPSAVRGETTWRRVEAAIEKLVRIDELTLLTDEEVDRVAVASGIDADFVERAILARRLAKRLGQGGTPADAEICFGLLAVGVRPSIDAVLQLRESGIRKQLDVAAARHHVRAPDAERLRRFLAAVHAEIRRPTPRATETRTHAPTRGPAEVLAEPRSLAERDGDVRAVLTAGLGDGLATTFLEAWHTHDGDAASFWKALAKKEAFASPEALARARFTMQIGALCDGHAPMVSALVRHGARSVRDLAALSESDWRALVAGAGVPETVTGADEKERAEAWTRALFAAVERAEPTAALAAAMKRDVRPSEERVRALLEAHADIDLRGDGARRWVRANKAALVAAGDAPSTVKALTRTSRLFGLVEGPDRLPKMRALADAGRGTARRVATRSKRAFVEELGDRLGGPAAAEKTWRTARTIVAGAELLYAERRAGAKQIELGATGDATAVAPDAMSGDEALGIPSYDELFGRADFCACEDCRSVLSPAAYLVDLLHFLENGPRAGGDSHYTRLRARRPDVPLIELTCTNTTTVLPYVDVANEIMEHAVAGDIADVAARGAVDVPWLDQPFPVAAPETVPGRQTTGRAEDLALHPEHRRASAYTVLGVARYPWSLPFELGTTEIRAHLRLVATTRLELLDVFDAADPGTAPSLARRTRSAQEILGMADTEREIVVASDGMPPATYWGARPAPLAFGALDGVAVSELLTRSGLGYEAFADLLKSAWVNPVVAGWRVDVVFAPGTCALDQAKLGARPADVTVAPAELRARLDGVLARAHRFERLRARLGWTAYELDVALDRFAAGPDALTRPLSNESVIALAAAARLSRELRLSVLDVLSLYRAVATIRPDEDTPSAYERLFANPSVANPPDARLALRADRADLVGAALLPADAGFTALAMLVGLPSDASAPAPFGASAVAALGEVAPLVAGALRLNTADLTTLLGALPLSTVDDPTFVPPATDPSAHPPRFVRLDLANLSLLHRAATLARAMKTSIDDFVVLARLDGTDPFSDPEATLVWCKEARLAKTAPMKLADVDLLVRDPARVVDDATVGVVLRAVRAGVVASPDAADDLRSIQLVGVLAEALALPGDIVGDLVGRFVHVDPGGGAFDPPLTSGDACARVFLDRGFLGAAEPPGAEDDVSLLATASFAVVQARAVRKLAAIAGALKRLGVARDELAILFERGPAAGWLELDAIPDAERVVATDITAAYGAWKRLRELYRLRAELGGATGPLFRMMQVAFDEPGANVEDWLGGDGDGDRRRSGILDVLVGDARFATGDVDSLVGSSGFSLSTPASWTDERQWRRLLDALGLAHRTGLPAGLLAGLTTDASLAAAESLKAAVRSKYDDAAWATAARPVRDALREAQRDALATWLVANGVPGAPSSATIESVGDVYRWLLIDVEMGACAQTSRVREALNAIQLYVQEVLLGVAPETPRLDFDVEERERWDWMSRYRVWEANRKIFLWPENWMEPELRDDKSPFYESMESQLLQEEITDDAAERAYAAYLDKLDQVAHLEVRATYHEIEPKNAAEGSRTVDRLHVVARTHAHPHVHYHRVRELGVWSPWERIDAEIPGDHVQAVVSNRRLYVLWPIFGEKAQPVTSTSVPNPTKPDAHGNSQSSVSTPVPPAKTNLEVQLGWTELRDGKWSAARKSEVLVTCEDTKIADADQLFTLVAREEGRSPLWVGFGALAHGYATSDVNEDGWMIGGGPPVVVDAFSAPIPGAVPAFARRWELLYPWHDPDAAFWGGAAETFIAGGVVDNWYAPFLTRRLALPTSKSDAAQHREALTTPPLAYRLGPVFGRRYVAGRIDVPVLFFDDLRRAFVIEHTDSPLSWVVAPDVDDLVATAAPPVVAAKPPLRGVLRHDPAGPLAVGVHVGGVPPADDPWRGVAPYRAPYAGGATALMTRPIRERAPDARAGLIDEIEEIVGAVTAGPKRFARKYRFSPFYHPYVDLFRRALNRDGVDGLLAPIPTGPVTAVNGLRTTSDDARYLVRQGQGIDVGPRGWRFEGPASLEGYGPTSLVDPRYPAEDIDFTSGGAYSGYNWELFFHAPLQIACRLMQNQKFEDARRWFHTIFDPTDTFDAGEETPRRYWKLKPLYELYWQTDPAARGIDQLLFLYSGGAVTGVTSAEAAAVAASVGAQIAAWQAAPFEPYVVARIRQSAFQKLVFRKYLDNLLAWGDSLFRAYTTESVNEATLLYSLAKDLLGPRPEEVPVKDTDPLRYADRAEDRAAALGGAATWDDFANVLDEIVDGLISDVTPQAWDDPPPVSSPSLYFCVPPNENLLAYYALVDDRLYKIHHCLDIDGVARPLALFDPPIDPAALVRAGAGGAGLAGAIAAAAIPLPNHRYHVLAAKAGELAGDVRALGSAVLAALEKRDAEALALLRSTHELTMLDRVREVRKAQLEEATDAKKALEASRKTVEERQSYYDELSKAGLSAPEKDQTSSMSNALDKMEPTPWIQVGIGVVSLIPDFKIGVEGFGGSPAVTATWGSSNLVGAAQAADTVLQHWAAIDSHRASMSSIVATEQRRADEWKYQLAVATKELAAIDAQIETAEVKRQIAERELANHEKQTELAKETDAFLRSKFTNRELYDWMVTQLSATCLAGWQLALDVARKAERSWNWEVAPDETETFVRPDSWDSLRKGLLAGEKLHLDLRRMDAAWHDRMKRDHELTRHVSLAQIAPDRLQALRATGTCSFTVPELLFDLDRPGHYFRRLKAVAVSMPAVAGPYAPVHATVTLTSSSLRIDPTAPPGGYARNADGDGAPIDDARFVDFVGLQSVVTSTATQDNGLFENNLRDERFLPFEGHGAVNSRWTIALPSSHRAFDYDTIADVVLHLRYTAREGGAALANEAVAALDARVAEIAAAADGVTLARVFNLRTEDPAEWQRLLAGTPQAMNVSLARSRFPYAYARGGLVRLQAADLFVFGAPGIAAAPAGLQLRLTNVTRDDGGSGLVTAATLPMTDFADGRVLRGSFTWSTTNEDDLAPTGGFRLDVTAGPTAGPWQTGGASSRLVPGAVRDAYLVVYYRVLSS